MNPLTELSLRVTRRQLLANSLRPLGAAALILFAISATQADSPFDELARKNPKSRVTISKETTWITEPLTNSGYPDYLAWVNRKYSQGITPENNAAVLLWQIVGPGKVPKSIREEYFRKLGVTIPPAEGKYYLPPEDYFEQHHERGRDFLQSQNFSEQCQQAGNRPWSEKEFPDLAWWLAANEKFLDVAVELSGRPRFYAPLVSESKSSSILGSYDRTAFEVRGIAAGLSLRAMLQIQQGDIKRAWADVIAVARLSRLCSQGASVNEQFATISTQRYIHAPLISLAQSGKLTAKQAVEFRRQLHEAHPRLDYLSKIDEWDRIQLLDVICSMAAEDGTRLDKISGAGKLGVGLGFQLLLEWDVALKSSNDIYDALVADARITDPDSRWMKLRKWVEQVDADVNASKKRIASAQVPGQVDAKLLSQDMAIIANGTIRRDPSAMMLVYHRAETVARMNEIVLALAGFRSDQSKFPDRLEDLRPRYMNVIPTDAYRDAELRYQRTTDGFRLYSLGRNGKDEVGRNHSTDEIVGDDDIIELP